MENNIEIKYFATEWGNSLPINEFLENIKKFGYNGIEMSLPFESERKKSILKSLKSNGLELIGQYFQSYESDFRLHKYNYEKHLNNLLEAEPLFINCQTGKDYFSKKENLELFMLAQRLSSSSGINIIHETHRGKSLFAAHITQSYLESFPDLKICLDISHWCNVHESLLEDQEEALNLAFERSVHIHSRIGFPEGPQVNDPRAPEWQSILERHLFWWDKVVEINKQNKRSLTITTEFGPAPYMPLQPYSQIPISNQWDINIFMLELLKNRYSNKPT
ncbi:sugar phosphate isomerase/epimerase family protein [Pedobacter glucosidilyticus]|uniref:sugar phosphate isomerase/epimerase family protein n=1 Tax=Pedobacter glucosidilyticus TaxID=1122941 RepID=UPI0026F10719|nr:sugar phosphate isomerase/epimerase [Pedobacter glucosidilyticus]